MKLLFTFLTSLLLAILTLTGHLQNHIFFADPINELLFAGANLSIASFCFATFAIQHANLIAGPNLTKRKNRPQTRHKNKKQNEIHIS